VEVFRDRPVDIEQLEVLFQADADPKFRIEGDNPIGLVPMLLDNL